MPPTLKHYDPVQVVVTFKGVLVQGYADGAFVAVARDEDTFSKSTGAGGDTVRVRNRNRNGSITVTIQAESPTNDSFSAIAALDEASGLGTGAVQVKNLNGTTLCSAAQAWLVRPADSEYAKDAGTREWKIDCHDLKMLVGGALI